MSSSSAASSSSSSSSGPSQSTYGGVPAPVIKTLAFFTAAMVVVPLLTFYGTKNLVFGEERKQWAGLAAALAANVVVITYVVFAFNEDGGKAEREAEVKKDK
ncbi:hypothetical protein V1514DRAFT_141257 [Lipomyces japonicus]|uniref:uncharacterized protein n=1 Tax=Lipomyces japonicus TaxID=56871 RepID=UPI0034CDA662